MLSSPSSPQILRGGHYYPHFIAVEIDPVSSQTVPDILDHQAGVERCEEG